MRLFKIDKFKKKTVILDLKKNNIRITWEAFLVHKGLWRCFPHDTTIIVNCNLKCITRRVFIQLSVHSD